jgi:hypothetical protein
MLLLLLLLLLQAIEPLYMAELNKLAAQVSSCDSNTSCIF